MWQQAVTAGRRRWGDGGWQATWGGVRLS